ncbi:MAG TPA: DUF1223 domain-containing protein [Alphaproteobacteria bacterium]|jgi:hypothetical protein
MNAFLHRCVLAAALLAASVAAGPTQAGEAPVVVELFTSQGCNTCPPADAYLGELAKRHDVVALSLHVDYWNYIGWEDPFAIAIATKRQRAYSSHLGRGFVYTPQIVVDGAAEAVGSHRDVVAREIEKARAAAGKFPVEIAYKGDDTMVVSLPAGDSGGKEATVWLVLFDAKHTTDIKRGENGGKRLTYYNVVREFRPVGTWVGKPKTLTLKVEDEGRDGCAVLVQVDGTGRIVGAGKLAFAAAR